nr:LLDR protein Lu14-4819 [Linum usitatissimum]FAA04167.1 TPA: flax LLDR protein Lu14-4819 [Linum usitatissimum]
MASYALTLPTSLGSNVQKTRSAGLCKLTNIILPSDRKLLVVARGDAPIGGGVFGKAKNAMRCGDGGDASWLAPIGGGVFGKAENSIVVGANRGDASWLAPISGGVLGKAQNSTVGANAVDASWLAPIGSGVFGKPLNLFVGVGGGDASWLAPIGGGVFGKAGMVIGVPATEPIKLD